MVGEYHFSAHCHHEQGLYASVACSRLLDSGEDVKVEGARKRGGSGERKKEKVSSRYIFVFALCQFRGPDYLGAWDRLMLLQ